MQILLYGVLFWLRCTNYLLSLETDATSRSRESLSSESRSSDERASRSRESLSSESRSRDERASRIRPRPRMRGPFFRR